MEASVLFLVIQFSVLKRHWTTSFSLAKDLEISKSVMAETPPSVSVILCFIQTFRSNGIQCKIKPSSIHFVATRVQRHNCFVTGNSDPYDILPLSCYSRDAPTPIFWSISKLWISFSQQQSEHWDSQKEMPPRNTFVAYSFQKVAHGSWAPAINLV